MRTSVRRIRLAIVSLVFAGTALAQSTAVTDFKAQVGGDVEAMKKQTQVMIDMVFSFGELGFHEVETSKYLTGILEKEGFTVERGIAGMPTAWMATWGSGKPVIALGSDIDCIPQASQQPGVAYRSPMIEGAPGHGEGHNSGQPLNITSALAVKRLMQRAGLRGTLKLWPGVAEEQLGAKAHLVRAGYFKEVDVVLFTHVGNNLEVAWGTGTGTGLVSVEYRFRGETAHSATSPWRGRSALDAVELMNVGWNYRREHLRLQQRSHYVITNGGDQPNVVPAFASVWYFFRELEFDRIRSLRETGDTMAKAAAMMSDTSVTSRVLGSAWPGHFNKPVAEAVHANIKQVGLPPWTEADQTLAKALQGELKAPVTGLPVQVKNLQGPATDETRTGGSDDIGDVSWNVPTVVLRYPANIPNLPGHNWANAIAMATPIAHKGTTAGAKVLAMTIVDILTQPALVDKAWDYFRTVQTRDQKYQPLISPEDKPATWLNTKIMAEYREPMRKFYYDPSRYDTYLEQLGIRYPTVRRNAPAASKAK
ncbi:MAG: amidohydrolase [Verrucomicrobia bacterium]|nr:amidohydrolase [Verrucomicrobiota bacterium]